MRPSNEDLAAALAYIEREFVLRDGRVDSEMIAEALAYGLDNPNRGGSHPAMTKAFLEDAKRFGHEFGDNDWKHILARADRLRDEQGIPRRPKNNPPGDGREHEPELSELIDALELYNDNTDSATVPPGGEKIYVFIWPPEGGRDGEWQLLSHVNPKKHQAEYGGKFAEIRIPGHEGNFNAFGAAVAALRALGIKVSNPELAAVAPAGVMVVPPAPKANPSKKYVKCELCGVTDATRQGHVGTSTEMRCPDCGGVERLTRQGIEIGGPARRCRDCCPSGHHTHAAGETPGLKKNPNPNYIWFVSDGEIIYSGWEFKSDAKDDLTENGDFYYSYLGDNPEASEIKVISRRGYSGDPEDNDNWAVLKKPAPKKNPDANYRWFVVVGHKIFSGWEFSSDAKDDLRDNRVHYFNVGHAQPKLLARRTLVQMGIDPDDTDNWYGYAPATATRRSR